MASLLSVSIVLASLVGQVSSSTSEQPEAPLAGPRVGPKNTKPTIVFHDLDGKVRRPELSPEEAVVGQLELDPETKGKVDALFAKRARVLESVIEENLDLMIRLVTAQSAPNREKWSMAFEALEKTKALREDGPLDQQVRAVLSADQAKLFDQLLRAYWNAITAEDAKLPKPKGRMGAVIDEKFKSLGREVEAAYKRCEKSGAILYHYLFDSMTLTPEQSRQLRALCSQYSMNGIDNNDKRAQGAMFVAVMQILTPEQGKELARKFKGGQPVYKKPKGKSAPATR